MEAKFDEQGDLHIKRSNGWVPQICPFSESRCGTWCPHVTEPFLQRNSKFNGREEMVLHICHGKHWKFTSFEDRRQPI